MSRLPTGSSMRSASRGEILEAAPDVATQDGKAEGNPFLSDDWRMVSYAWVGFAVRVFLILGGLFTVYEYMQAREEKRVERTLELVELWEREEFQAAQRALKQRLAGLNEQYAGLLGANAGPGELAVYRERIGLEAMAGDGGTMPAETFAQHFDAIVYFLNRLSSCVEENLCSGRIADAYFRDFAVSFWSYFGGHIRQQRRLGQTTLARPIERYVGDGG
ncbi:hypothetical protein N1F89_06815 [Aquibium sp. A9E412]|uniref:hypothetical protein n=1 Tax=Aquibium sp. A9E412 TaxID=2976767 RepID=UPI0025B055E8|nr:hypothetical protein [Aquibium sp. A9E412]MDN2565926.1 hypothetical protein [Aquibium sp. A9E412]